MRRENSKVVSSSFQEIFNWEKAWQSKNNDQNNAFCLPFIGFFTKRSQYQIWKANTYSILTNRNQTWTARLECLTRISKFYDPTDSEHKFHKMKFPKFRNFENSNICLIIYKRTLHTHTHTLNYATPSLLCSSEGNELEEQKVELI